MLLPVPNDPIDIREYSRQDRATAAVLDVGSTYDAIEVVGGADGSPNSGWLGDWSISGGSISAGRRHRDERRSPRLLPRTVRLVGQEPTE